MKPLFKAFIVKSETISNNNLGKWAVIDIETTGLDPIRDKIIDIGFLCFENTRLVRRYESLVCHKETFSLFIQKLTGITPSRTFSAPTLEQLEPELAKLDEYILVAHNSDFERSFLTEHCSKIIKDINSVSYQDSIPYLALLFPKQSDLKLEKFIQILGIADKETHRGLQDAIDLLKVLLVATAVSKQKKGFNALLTRLVEEYNLTNWWYTKFYHQSLDDLKYIADEIGFSLESATKEFYESSESKNDEEKKFFKKPMFKHTFSKENIESIYQSQKELEGLFPGYQYRKPQEELSVRVGRSFKNNIHGMIQAPTGTGKTLGYLLPTALFTLDKSEQVLISTGTKTLQKQAITKDIPRLRKMLSLGEDKLKIQLLMGAGNHLCELLFRSDKDSLFTYMGDLDEKFGSVYLELIFAHNAQSDLDDQILRGDLPFVIKSKFKSFQKKERDIAADFRSCIGHHCPFKFNCSYHRHLKAAREADIIIGNHALMFSWPKGFSRPSYIVIDEAHKIESEITKTFSLETTQEGLESLVQSLQNNQGFGSLFFLLSQTEQTKGESTPIIEEIKKNVKQTQELLVERMTDLPDDLEAYIKQGSRYTEEYWNEIPMPEKDKIHNPLAQQLYYRFESIYFILTGLVDSFAPYGMRWTPGDLSGEEQVTALSAFETFLESLKDLVGALKISIEHDKDYSHSLRYHERYGYALTSAPIDVGQIIHDKLLDESESVIFTSATLGNSRGNQGIKGIEWMTGYSYLTPQKRFRTGLFLPALYDYKNNTKIFLSDDVPLLYDQSFVETTLRPIIKLIREIDGKSLLLYSAIKRFESAREILLDEFDGKIPLFIQGMGGQVVDEFKKTGGILLGMESFGEGIDIPGDVLQFIFIDKIPDVRMDQVIKDRREFYQAKLGNEFTDYYLSQRARSLHQKLGRLLRTEDDRGGAIIVDGRVKKWKGRTMKQMIDLMSPYEIHQASLDSACGQIRDFILQ